MEQKKENIRKFVNNKAQEKKFWFGNLVTIYPIFL